MFRPLPLAVLCLTAVPAAAQDLPFQIPKGAARAEALWEDAQAMSKTHLPTKADLGEGWRLPWELAAVVPGMIHSEARYWSRAEPNDDDRPHWHWFYGLTEAEALAELQGSVGEMAGQLEEMLAGEDISGHPMAEFATAPGLMKIMIMQARLKNRLVFESHPIFATRLAESSLPITLDYIRARSGQMPPDEAAALEMKAMRHHMDLFSGDLNGKDLDTHIAVYARNASVVRRFTQMEYVHINEGELKNLKDGQMPSYGKYEVQLHVLAQNAIGREVNDLTGDELKTLDTELTKLLNTLVDNLAPGAGTYGVECLSKDFGDNAWVIAIDGPSFGGQDMKGFYGRVRSGNAIVDIKGTGSLPRDTMLQQMDYILGVAEDSTSMFGEEEGW